MKKLFLLLAVAITTSMNASAQNLITDGTFETGLPGNGTITNQTGTTGGVVPDAYARNTWGGLNDVTVAFTTGGYSSNCGSFAKGATAPAPNAVYFFQRLTGGGSLSASKTYRLSARFKTDAGTCNGYMFIRKRSAYKLPIRADFVYSGSDTYAGIKTVGSTSITTSWTQLSQSFVFSNSVTNITSTTQPPATPVPFTQGEMDDLVVGFYTTTAAKTLYVDDVVFEEVLPAPTANSATGITTNSFTASWAAVTGATGYQLDVSTNNTFTALLASYNNLPVSGTSQVVSTGLLAGTTYYYRVRAVNVTSMDNSSTITATTLTDASLVKDGSFISAVAGNFTLETGATYVNNNTARSVWGGLNNNTGTAPVIGVTTGGATGNCAFFTPGEVVAGPASAYLFQKLPNPSNIDYATKTYKLTVKLKADAAGVNGYLYIKCRPGSPYALRTDWVTGQNYPWVKVVTGIATSWTEYSQTFVFSNSVTSATQTPAVSGAAFTLAQVNDLNFGFYSTGGTAYVDDVAFVESGSAAPTITGAATATAFTTTYGTASAKQDFAVSGSNLTDGITATAPTGFEVASDGTTFGPTATIPQSGGTASGTISVRLKYNAAVSGTYNSQNIVLSNNGGAPSINISTAASGNSVSKNALTISAASIASKVYNKTNTTGAVTPGTLSGLVDTETLTVSAVGAFTTSTVGTAKSATITYTLGNGTNGGLANNYSLATSSATGDVTTKTLTMSGLSVPSSKEYNGTTAAVVSGTPTLQTSEAAGTGNSDDGIPYTGDVVSITGTPVGTYNSKDVASATTITYSGLSLIGGQRGNYTLTIQEPSASTITAKALTIGAASIASKVYDGSATSGTVTAGTLSGFVGSETVIANTAVGTYPDANVGTGKTATIVYTLGNGNNGGLATNYSLANGSASGTITAATLTLNNAATTFNASSYTLTDLENSDLVVSSGEFNADRTTNTIHSVTVAPGAKLSLGSNTLSITGDLFLKADVTNSFNANIGSGTLAVTGAIKYLRTIDQSKWYFMAFPSDVTIAQITATNTALGALGTDWYIKYYDGAKRGTSGGGANWISITADDITADPTLKLNKYQGYIVGLKNGKPDTELSFPLDKAVVSTESTRSITVAANNAGAISATNHGWNLIGQPYLSKYVGSNATGVFNIYISDGTSTYTPYTKATVPMMLPMSAYFIQASTTLAGTGISFNTAGRQSVPSLVAIDSSDEVQLNLTSATGTDYTLLTMDNNLSTDYEIGYDLEKWIGTGTDKPQVYSQLNGINYAFNALPMISVNNLPIGIYTKNAGNTTISVNATQAPSLSKLLLTDNATSPATITDLLTSVYSFTATAGTDNTRFVLTAQRVPTASVIETEANGTTFTIVNSVLYINNLNGKASVRVFDAIGRTIANKTLNNSLLEIQLPAIGMYSVQIEANGKIWTRKIFNQK